MSVASIKNSLHGQLDLIGAFLSLACAVHCIAIPALVVVLPLLGLSFFLNTMVEKVFVIASISLAAFNLCWGYRIHKRTRTLLIFSAAAVMVISGTFVLPHQHDPNRDVAIHSQSIHLGHIHSHPGDAGEPMVGSQEHHRRPQDNPLGLLLLVVGATAIAASHLLNRNLCKSCQNCKTSHTH